MGIRGERKRNKAVKSIKRPSLELTAEKQKIEGRMDPARAPDGKRGDGKGKYRKNKNNGKRREIEGETLNNLLLTFNVQLGPAKKKIGTAGQK